MHLRQKNKMIPIVISTISHFWSPKLRSFGQSVFVSFFSMAYTTPHPEIYFFVRAMCVCVYVCVCMCVYVCVCVCVCLSCSQRLGKFQIFCLTFCIRDLISFLGQAIFFHKAINDQSCKLKNSWQNYLFHVCLLTFLNLTREFSLIYFP